MRAASWLLLFVLITLASACAGPASQPPPPIPRSSASGSVGILNFAHDRYWHIHVGTTVFNNFEKSYSPRASWRQMVTDNMSSELGHATIPARIISNTEERFADPDSFFALNGWTGWRYAKIKPDAGAWILDQMRKEHVDRVLVAMPSSTSSSDTPTLPEYGFFSHSFIGLSRCMAYSAVYFFWVDSALNVTMPPWHFFGDNAPTTEKLPNCDIPARNGELDIEHEQELQSIVQKIMHRQIVAAVQMLSQ